MVAGTLGALIMIAVLAAFAFITRAGLTTQSYTDMEGQSRNAMELFAQDVRMASDIRWNSSQSLTLTVKNAGNTEYYTYAYDAASGSFARQQVVTPSGQAPIGSPSVLITGIKPGTFQFTAYKIDTGTINLASISEVTDRMTKQVQIALETQRTRAGLATASNKVISARFILRNKKVTA